MSAKASTESLGGVVALFILNADEIEPAVEVEHQVEVREEVVASSVGMELLNNS